MFLCPVAKVVWGGGGVIAICFCFHQRTRPASYEQFWSCSDLLGHLKNSYVLRRKFSGTLLRFYTLPMLFWGKFYPEDIKKVVEEGVELI
jgi:hypothetical protein